jgi:putative peptidoglycan lipid II flippase
MKLVKAMTTVAGYSLLSRVTGMVRDILSAAVLGTGPLADAYFVALKLPNMFRRIAAEGAFSVSFIPLYSRTLENEGEESAAHFAGRTFSIMTIVMSFFTILMMIGMPWVIRVIAPGFEDDGLRYMPAVEMTQITFPYLMLMTLTSLFGGMLNAHNKFGPFAAAPIVFNAFNIAAILIAEHWFPESEKAVPYGLAWAVSISGIFQLLLMLFFIRRHKIKFHWQGLVPDEKVRKMFRLMGPGVLAAGILQINIFVDTIFASTLGTGAVSYLYYADRLNQLPLGVIGLAVGSALLPLLSRSVSSNNINEARDLFNRSLEHTYLVALPASVALLVAPVPFVALLFERGEFTRADTMITSYVLMGYAMGLPAYIAGKVFATVFWSRQDTLTPVKVSIATSVLNIILCVLFIKPLGVAGIALATGLSGWLQLYLYTRLLKKDEVGMYDDRFRSVFHKIALSTCLMAAVLSGLSYVLQDWVHGDTLRKILAVGTMVGAAGITYFLAVLKSGVFNINDIKELLKRKKALPPAKTNLPPEV